MEVAVSGGVALERSGLVSVGGALYRWRVGGHKDQASQVSGTLIAECAGSIDQGSDTIGLNGRAYEGRTPACGGGGSFPALEEFFLAVCGLGPVVGVTKQRGKDAGRGDLVEDHAEGDGRRLDRREV